MFWAIYTTNHKQSYATVFKLGSVPQLQRLLFSNLLVLFTESRKRYGAKVVLVLCLQSCKRLLQTIATWVKRLVIVKLCHQWKCRVDALKELAEKKSSSETFPLELNNETTEYFQFLTRMVKIKRNLILETTQPQSANCIENCVGFSKRIRIVICSLDSEPDCFVLRPSCLEGSGGEACHFCCLCQKRQKRSFRFVCTETKKFCLLQKSPYFCLGLYACDWSNEKSGVIETFLRRSTRFARNYHAGASREKTDRSAV